MTNIFRTIVVIGLAVGLVALFLRNADLHQVWAALRAAHAGYLLLSLLMLVLTFIVRAERWQYLLAPLGPTRFSVVFRTTVIGFGASAVLPARAGEVIRPYLLARREGLSAPAAMATIVLERLLDLASVLVLVAVFLLFFDPGLESRDSGVFSAIKFGSLLMAPAALGGLVVMFFLAGHPDKLHAWLLKAEAILPASMAHMVARMASTFVEGFAVLRQFNRLVAALGWSLVIWLLIATSIWAVSVAFGIAMPFTGAWLMLAPLVVGVAVPTPGGVGGFHEAYRIGATAFFHADNNTAVAAAIVLHAISVVPVTVAGLLFMLQDGLSLTGFKMDQGVNK